MPADDSVPAPDSCSAFRYGTSTYYFCSLYLQSESQ